MDVLPLNRYLFIIYFFVPFSSVIQFFCLCFQSLRHAKQYTAISRKVVGKNVYATIPKGNMGYDQYTVPDFVAVETTFVAFL